MSQHPSSRSASMRTDRSGLSRASGRNSANPASAARGASNFGTGSRVSLASHYSNTNETPMHKEVSGVPISTITATGLAAIFYVISIITILATDCPFSREVIYFFTFLLVSLLALAAMAGINMVFTKYRFNCLSLSISLLYSGSAALILLGLVESAAHGLCRPSESKPRPRPRPSTSPATVTTPGVSNITRAPTAKPQLDELTTMVYRLIEDQATKTTSYVAAALSGESRQESGGLFSSGFVPNYVIWFGTAVGLCFQLVAHYYYG